MPEDLEARLRALEDREAIRELRATYCFLIDDGRFDELVDGCFTDDARCEFGAADGNAEALSAQGREEVRAFFSQGVASLLRDMAHTVHNHRISLEDDRASGDCYFELTATDVASGEDVVGAGRGLEPATLHRSARRVGLGDRSAGGSARRELQCRGRGGLPLAAS